MNEITVTTEVVTVGGTLGFTCKREIQLLGLKKGDKVELVIRGFDVKDNED